MAVNCSKRYSPEEIEALKKNPNVLEVRENRLLLTIEFRQQVYEAWIRRPERSTVRRMLEANGFDTQRLGLNFTKSVESVLNGWASEVFKGIAGNPGKLGQNNIYANHDCGGIG